MQPRVGWSYEYADTGRPVSATLAGAPAMPFTTFGVAPQRDGVVLGLSANTAITEAMSIYLRYEGDISGQDSAHAITAGLRMTGQARTSNISSEIGQSWLASPAIRLTRLSAAYW